MIIDEKRPRIGYAALAFLGACVVSVGVWFVMFYVRDFPLLGAEGGTMRLLPEQALACGTPWKYVECRSVLASYAQITTNGFHATLAAMFVPPVAILAWLLYLVWDRDKPTNRRIESGAPVREVDAAKAALEAEIKGEGKNGRGIRILPNIDSSRKRDKRGYLIFGAPGSGKSLFINGVLGSIQASRHRLIVVDSKGDYTATLLDDVVDGAEKPPILLAPHDKRSAVWSVAEDVVTREDAIELASLLIPQGGKDNPFFPDSAKAVLTVCILSLMAEKPMEWTWEDMRRETEKSHDELREMAENHYPGAVQYLSEMAHAQVAGTLSTLQNAMQSVAILGTAWNDARYKSDKVETFSLKRFLYEANEGRTVILQRSGRFASLTDGWMSAFLSLAGGLVGTVEMAENDDLPTWVVVDEFGELPRIPRFERLVNQGRSKGVRVVVAAQDFTQIRATYGQELAESFQAMFGTMLLGRLSVGESVHKFCRDMGDVTYSWGRKVPNGNGGYRYDRIEQKMPAFAPSDFVTLGDQPSEGGCRMLMLNVADGPVRCLVPYGSYAIVRAASSPAEWTGVEYSERLSKAKGDTLKVEAAAAAAANADDDDGEGGGGTAQTIAPMPHPQISKKAPPKKEEPTVEAKAVEVVAAPTPLPTSSYSIPGGYGSDVAIDDAFLPDAAICDGNTKPNPLQGIAA